MKTTLRKLFHKELNFTRASRSCRNLVLRLPRICIARLKKLFVYIGTDYEPPNEKVGKTNLVTIDLSPSINCVWDDCTRSFYVENGRCNLRPTIPEFVAGFELERSLHEFISMRMLK